MVHYHSISLLADTLITLTMLGQIVPLKDTEHCSKLAQLRPNTNHRHQYENLKNEVQIVPGSNAKPAGGKC